MRWRVKMSVRSSTRELRRLAAACSVVLAAALGSPGVAEDGKAITVAAAMSLRNVLPPMIEAFRKSSGAGEITVTYGASGDLRRQVEGGAPIDAVVFAAAADVDLLAQRGQIAGDKRVVASNSLILIGPAGGQSFTFESIDSVPEGEHIAIGDPKTVPAGRYAQEALQALGKWDAVQDRLVYGGHVAAVLQYARRGEVAAAIVYRTDVIGVGDIAVLDEASGEWAPRIETVAGVVAGGKEDAARAFITFLETEAGRGIFASQGFAPPPTAVAAVP